MYSGLDSLLEKPSFVWAIDGEARLSDDEKPAKAEQLRMIFISLSMA